MKKILALSVAFLMGFVMVFNGVIVRAAAPDYNDTLTRVRTNICTNHPTAAICGNAGTTTPPDTSTTTNSDTTAPTSSPAIDSSISMTEGTAADGDQVFDGYLETDKGKVYLRESDVDGNLLAKSKSKDAKLPPLLSKALTNVFYTIIRGTGARNMTNPVGQKVRTLVEVYGMKNKKTGAIGVDAITVIRDVLFATISNVVNKAYQAPAEMAMSGSPQDFYGYLQFVKGQVFLLESYDNGKLKYSKLNDNGKTGPRLLGADMYKAIVALYNAQLADNKTRVPKDKIRILVHITGMKDKKGSIKVLTIDEMARISFVEIASGKISQDIHGAAPSSATSYDNTMTSDNTNTAPVDTSGSSTTNSAAPAATVTKIVEPVTQGANGPSTGQKSYCVTFDSIKDPDSYFVLSDASTSIPPNDWSDILKTNPQYVDSGKLKVKVKDASDSQYGSLVLYYNKSSFDSYVRFSVVPSSACDTKTSSQNMKLIVDKGYSITPPVTDQNPYPTSKMLTEAQPFDLILGGKSTSFAPTISKKHYCVTPAQISDPNFYTELSTSAYPDLFKAPLLPALQKQYSQYVSGDKLRVRPGNVDLVTTVGDQTLALAYRLDDQSGCDNDQQNITLHYQWSQGEAGDEEYLEFAIVQGAGSSAPAPTTSAVPATTTSSATASTSGQVNYSGTYNNIGTGAKGTVNISLTKDGDTLKSSKNIQINLAVTKGVYLPDVNLPINLQISGGSISVVNPPSIAGNVTASFVDANTISFHADFPAYPFEWQAQVQLSSDGKTVSGGFFSFPDGSTIIHNHQECTSSTTTCHEANFTTTKQ